MTKQTKQNQENVVHETPKKKVIKFKFHKKFIVIAVVLLLLTGGIYFGKGLIVAAIVNGKLITRYSLIASLEKTQGKQALDNLVTEALIKQEVKKANITVTQAEIDTDLAKIEAQVSSQGLTLDQALAKEKITKKDLIAQLTLQKQLEKILSKDITVTDDEIKQYIEANSNYLPTDTKPEDLNAQVKAQLTQQKLSTQYQAWIAGVTSKAKINYFVNF